MESKRGKPTKRALVVAIQATFPALKRDHLTHPVVASAALAMCCLVVGETMSFKAAMRSAKVSLEGS